MKISSTFEQGVYVVMILALEKDHHPVKSKTMSQLLDVFDSDLKKVLMKLSHGGLVISNASKRGGYVLARPANEISLKDVFIAVGEGEGLFKPSYYAERLFPHKEHVEKSKEKIETTIKEGMDAFYMRLDGLKVADLLEEGAWEKGVVDWEDKL